MTEGEEGEAGLLTSFHKCALSISPMSGKFIPTVQRRQGSFFCRRNLWKKAIQALQWAVGYYGQISYTVVDEQQFELVSQNLAKYKDAEVYFIQALNIASRLGRGGQQGNPCQTQLSGVL